MNHLPKFIKLYLLTFLDLTSLRNFSQTNKNNAELFRNSYIWKNRALHPFSYGESNYENYREAYLNVIDLHVFEQLNLFPESVIIFGKYFVRFVKIPKIIKFNDTFADIINNDGIGHTVQFIYPTTREKFNYYHYRLVFKWVNIDEFVKNWLVSAIENLSEITNPSQDGQMRTIFPVIDLKRNVL